MKSKLRSFLKKNLIFFILAGVSVACTNVDKLSDANRIKTFSVKSYDPSEIELGAVEITADDEILIPVKYGADKFPLRFYADYTFEAPVDQTAGADLNSELVLESLNDEIVFVVMAESGMPRRYVIKAYAVGYEAPEYMLMDIKSVQPETTLVFDKALIEEDVMTIFIINPGYPLTITPEFIFDANKIELPGFDNGNTPFTFDAYDSTSRIVIRDKEQGSSKDIVVKVEPLPVLTGEDEGSEALELTNGDVKVTMPEEPEGLDFLGYRIAQQRDSIALVVGKLDDNTEYPLTFVMDLEDFGDDAGYVGIDIPLELTFDGPDDEHYFYMADIDTRIARRWKVVLRELVEPGGAQILSVSYGYDAARVGIPLRPCITLDGFELYPSGNLWLRMTGHNGALGLATWKLTLKNVELAVSDGATYTLPDNLVYEGNESWKEVREITVTSRDGETKVWKLGIKDVRGGVPQSDERELTDVTLHSIMPVMAAANPGEPVVLDREEKTIRIRLEEDEDCYPLSVRLDYTLSDFAMVTSQENGTEPLKFETPESTQEVVITAENGEEDVWTVSLIPPVKTGGANVTAFKVTSYSSVFRTDKVVIDEEAGNVTIHLLNGGSCPVTVNYTMGLSRNARASVPTKGAFVFDRLSDTHEFTVTSIDGTTKDWTVKFARHAPQLQGADMDNWSSDNLYVIPTGARGTPYWSSANMKVLFVTVESTKRTEGAPGQGYAAGLTTQSNVKLASGSLFLGWFDKSDPTGNMNDAPVMVWQGIPFASTQRIKGIEADIWYSPGGAANSDSADITVALIRQRDPSKEMEYHGRGLDGNMHTKNNADQMAHGRIVVGTIDEGAKTKWGETVDRQVADSTWERVFVPLEYEGEYPVYSHLCFICSSSSRGDYFEGTVGSQLKIDNITIIYED